MFSLTIVDHVRLDSEQVDKNYMVHAQSAERIVRAVFACRVAIVALLAVATSVAVVSLLHPRPRLSDRDARDHEPGTGGVRDLRRART